MDDMPLFLPNLCHICSLNSGKLCWVMKSGHLQPQNVSTRRCKKTNYHPSP